LAFAFLPIRIKKAQAFSRGQKNNTIEAYKDFLQILPGRLVF
jgi:hypothetical protein